MTHLVARHLTKTYGERFAVRDVDLDIRSGAFVTLLGPSGCGKTTLLRLIAGLDRPSAGTVTLGGQLVAGPGTFVDAEDRNLGMVFQSYALWPHMTVARNIAFGLEVQRLPAAERRRRVEQALATVGLDGMADRRPSELSGGQRQRVALARCLALRTKLILLDEPLANLDAHLRETMQIEFRRIHKETGTTFIHVTHDQAEAMALADTIAVLSEGVLQQVASPEALYTEPANAMVARFVGRGNLLPVEVIGRAGHGRLVAAFAGAIIEVRGGAGLGSRLLCIRPDDIRRVPDGRPGQPGVVPGIVTDAAYRGGAYLVSAVLDDAENLSVEFASTESPVIGERVLLTVRDGWVLPEHVAERLAA